MKKNILYLSPSNRWLGARISLRVLLKMLDTNKFHPVIVCPSKDGPFANKLESDGFDVEYLRLWNWRKYKYFFHRAASVWKLRKLVKKHNIDLIHCNEFWTAPYAYWATRGINIPLVSHVRLDMASRKIRQYYLKYMTRVICVCKALVEEFSEWPDYKKRVVPIYNGVDLSEYDPALVKKNIVRREYGIDDKTLVIGLVGQISRRKGQDILISVAPQLIKEFPDIRFLFVGGSREPEYETEIHSMIKEKGLENHFIFTGPRRDMPQIYRSLDILVLPSLMEGFGRVVAEAEALEVPVVVSDAGGLVEVVKQEVSGFIYHLNNNDELLKYLNLLCADGDLRKRMGEAARERVKENFSQEIMAEKVQSLYLEIFQNVSE